MPDREIADFGEDSVDTGFAAAGKKPPSPEFATGKKSGDGDAALLAAMARPIEQASKENLSLKTKILHEVIEVGGVILYLFVSFAILETFRCGTLLAACSQNDFVSGYTTALVAALGLGKFVFVLEKMKFTQRFRDRPMIVPILYKTVMFTILANLILHAEDRILHRVTEQPHHFSDPTQLILCALTHQLAFFVMFFIFFCFRGVAHVIGEKRMFKLFFVSRDEFLSG